ncbi:MAG: cell wall hydrolase/autolysin, partial [Bacteroidota bacterium]
MGIKTIVLDAGHGGKDPGCFGHPLVEGKLNLAIAFKLGAFIEKNLPDIKVIYTRKTDKFLDIYQRAAIATRVKADLFISIHCNTMLAGARKDVQGTEVYVFGTYKTDENEEIAQRFIARENNSILLENDYPKYYGGFDPAVASTQAILTVKQSIFKEQSLKLANGIINESKKLLRITRGVHEGSFALLSLTTMPSVLVQTGYLSNPEENNELETERGQSRIAKSIFRAIKAY